MTDIQGAIQVLSVVEPACKVHDYRETKKNYKLH